MSEHINILILSAGRRVELVQAFQEALALHLPAAAVYATDVNPMRSAACQLAHDCFQVPPIADPHYIDSLLALCQTRKVGLVIPTLDTELLALAENRHRFLAVGTTAVVSDSALVSSCRDKRATSRLFDLLALDQPIIYPRDAIQFPCFCKPYDGSSSIGAKALRDASMLTPEILSDERNMFMELISKDYAEYTVDAYYDKSGRLRCLVPRERLEVRAGEVSKGVTRRNGVYEYLLPRLQVLPGARGCITVQVFAHRSNQSIKALEINPRFGGGYPLAHAAGADYPDWLVREYLLNQTIGFKDSWEADLVMLRYDAKVLVRDQN